MHCLLWLVRLSRGSFVGKKCMLMSFRAQLPVSVGLSSPFDAFAYGTNNTHVLLFFFRTHYALLTCSSFSAGSRLLVSSHMFICVSCMGSRFYHKEVKF